MKKGKVWVSERNIGVIGEKENGRNKCEREGEYERKRIKDVEREDERWERKHERVRYRTIDIYREGKIIDVDR